MNVSFSPVGIVCSSKRVGNSHPIAYRSNVKDGMENTVATVQCVDDLGQKGPFHVCEFGETHETFLLGGEIRLMNIPLHDITNMIEQTVSLSVWNVFIDPERVLGPLVPEFQLVPCS